MIVRTQIFVKAATGYSTILPFDFSMTGRINESNLDYAYAMSLESATG